MEVIRYLNVAGTSDTDNRVDPRDDGCAKAEDFDRRHGHRCVEHRAVLQCGVDFLAQESNKSTDPAAERRPARCGRRHEENRDEDDAAYKGSAQILLGGRWIVRRNVGLHTTPSGLREDFLPLRGLQDAGNLQQQAAILARDLPDG